MTSYQIDKAEVMRYLGYKGVILQDTADEIVNDSVIELCRKAAEPKSIFGTYMVEYHTADSVKLYGSNVILQGADIAAHLNNAREVVCMAVTLGAGIERELRRLQVNELSQAVVFDAVASTYAEAVADAVEEELKVSAAKRGFGLTSRFSPGYGDFPIEAQRDIIVLLSGEKLLGIHVTESMMMIPAKSITAILGMT